MNYKELLEYTKNNPGCLQTISQQKKEFEYRFYDWVKQQDECEENCSRSKQQNKNKE